MKFKKYFLKPNKNENVKVNVKITKEYVVKLNKKNDKI